MSCRALETCFAVALIVQASCAETPVDKFASLPTTSATCLANAHVREDTGLPVLPPEATASGKRPPIEVAANMVEGHRISGQRAIQPDLETKKAIQRAGVVQTSPSFKLCLDTSGVPVTVALLRSSCFPRYDAQLEAKMTEWRYSPYMVDGVGVTVCTQISFIYRQTAR